MYNPYNIYGTQNIPNIYNNQMPLNTLQNQPVSNNNLIRVNGIDGAKAYQMPPNSTTALFDGNDDLMYIKITDGAGFPTIKIYNFSEVSNSVPVTDNTDFVNRNEFEQFKKEVSEYVQLIISEPKQCNKSTNNQSSKGNDE